MKFFKREEFACKCGCGYDTVDYELADILEDVRAYFGKPITINSGCRCSRHNQAIGGKPYSQHVYGRAADIVVKDTRPQLVYNYLYSKYPDTYGLGNYDTFTHVDSRTIKARW